MQLVALQRLVVGGDGLKRGMTPPGGSRVVEQQLVVSRPQAPGREPPGEVTQAVLDRVPEPVHDIGVNAGRRASRYMPGR